MSGRDIRNELDSKGAFIFIAAISAIIMGATLVLNANASLMTRDLLSFASIGSLIMLGVAIVLIIAT